jgi:hypothetical protein
MPLKKLVLSQSLVFSAALAAFGCAGADTDTEGADVAPFSEWNRPSATNGLAPADTANAESADDSDSPTVPGATGANPTPSNEGENANNLPIAPANPAAAPASNGNAAGADQPATGMDTGSPEPAPPPPPRPPLDCSAPPAALTGGTMSCTRNAGGTVDGQRWFMWFAGSGGCMTAYDGGAFKATWNNSGDFLARTGLQWNETQTFEQYGTIGADLAFTKTGSGGSYSFIGIYGWSNNPLVEYYIVENSFGNGPATPYATTQRGTFNVDGASYKIYSGQKTNQPSLHGTANFQQFFSVRQTPRQCGHVSISEHFKQWQGMGMNLGKMSEARILVEAGGGSGSATFTTAYVTAGGG